jgi:hypothetical protein
MKISIAKSENKPKPEETTGNKKEHSEYSIQTDSPLDVVVKKEGRNWGSYAEWVMVVITAIGAVFIVLTVKYASDQAKASIDSNGFTLKEMNYRHAKDSTDDIVQHKKDSVSFAIADSSLSSTKQSIFLAKGNFRTENRPWVGVKQLVPLTLTANKDNSWQVVFQNYGKTPALKVIVFVNYEYHTIKTFDNFIYSKGPMSTAVVPPGENLTTAKIIIDSLELSQKYKSIMDSTFYLYIFGKADYTDIFKGRNTTRFCYIYDVGKSQFFISEKYNTME